MSEFFSITNLSDCFAHGLDSLFARKSSSTNHSSSLTNPNHSLSSEEIGPSEDLWWFANSAFMQHLIWNEDDELTYQNLIQTIIGDNLPNFDSATNSTSQNIDNDESKISWPNILFPILSLSKIIINSLGKFNQQSMMDMIKIYK